jgi:hypothetical protein
VTSEATREKRAILPALKMPPLTLLGGRLQDHTMPQALQLLDIASSGVLPIPLIVVTQMSFFSSHSSGMAWVLFVILKPENSVRKVVVLVVDTKADQPT